MASPVGLATAHLLETEMTTSFTDKEFYELKTDVALTKKTAENIEKLIGLQSAQIERQNNQIDELLKRTNNLESKMKTISYLTGIFIAIIIPILISLVSGFLGT